MQAQTAEADASIKRSRQAKVHRCCVYQALDIMGERFVPFTLGKAQDFFGLDLREDEDRLSHVQWSPDFLTDCAEEPYALGCIPRKVRVLDLIVKMPELFVVDPAVHKFIYWSPEVSRYCLLDLRARMPFAAPRGREGEPLASAHTTLYFMTMALAEGRELWGGVRLSVNDHLGCKVATVSYERRKIHIRPADTLVKMCLFERVPHLSN